MSIIPTPSNIKNHPTDAANLAANEAPGIVPLSEIKRPALRYYGGKWKLAPWIIGHFPAHKNYVEPCSGAASVLLQKPRSPLETYNDLDGNVVNFFRVLRDRRDELIEKIKFTPWSRAEYELSLQPCRDEVEQARRFFVAIWASIPGSLEAATPGRFRVTADYTQRPMALAFYHDDIYKVAERFCDVQIENDTWARVVARYDGLETLIYFDPPYMSSERTDKKVYPFEWTDTDHIEAATLLRSALGYVVVSGYACPLYTELYEAHGWRRVDKEAQTNSGGKRIESLWLSPRTVKALDSDYSHLPMFKAVQP